MGIPSEIKELKQWHVWRDEDGRKVPYQVEKFAKARSNDPSTWSTYEAAKEKVDSSDIWELAFTLGSGGIVGIDFDDAFNEDGSLRDWALEIWSMVKHFSYAEISPSGTGFKALMKASKPEDARCSASMGPGKQALEVYDNNRFWAITGEQVGENSYGPDATGLVRAVCSTWLKQDAPATVPVKPVEVQSSSNSSGSKFSQSETLDYRVRSYLSKIPCPGQGERNNVLFKAAGSLYGFGLKQEHVLSYISEFNLNCPNPLGQGEVNQVVLSAARNGTLRAFKGENKGYVRNEAPLNLDGLSVLEMDSEILDVDLEAPSEYRPMSNDHQIPRELMDDGGFIGSFMSNVVARQREEHWEMAFAAAIHVASMMLSRRYIDDSPLKTSPNLYSICLARSGSGKDTPRRCIQEYLQATDMSHVCGPDTIDSGAGLAVAITKTPSMSMLLDECGALFAGLAERNVPQHFRKAGSLLKTLYTSATNASVQPRSLASNDNGQNDVVEYPHLHVMGTATPRQVLDSITPDQIEDGLIGRFLMFFGCDSPEMKVPVSVDLSEELISWGKAWSGQASGSLSVPSDICNELSEKQSLSTIRRTKEAEERLENHYLKISQRNIKAYREGDESIGLIVWNRVSEKTAKLALLFAASRCADPSTCEITIDDANRAIAVSNHLANRVIKAYESRCTSEYQKARSEIMSLVPRGYITDPALGRLAKKYDPALRSRIIEDLISCKEITVSVKGGKTLYARGAV